DKIKTRRRQVYCSLLYPSSARLSTPKKACHTAPLRHAPSAQHAQIDGAKKRPKGTFVVRASSRPPNRAETTAASAASAEISTTIGRSDQSSHAPAAAASFTSPNPIPSTPRRRRYNKRKTKNTANMVAARMPASRIAAKGTFDEFNPAATSPTTRADALSSSGM